MTQKAKLFWSGRSQAVRLPKEFRFDGDEVRVRRHGNAVILEPIVDDWAWLQGIEGKFSDDMFEAAREQPPAEEREGLDELFSR
ncbi:antitoxin VapB [Silvibacterium bohemicum]|uniref:Antitoxin VapB n=1 Tax=Silvibacterium bohemicum TaxID=1577686 RepID=A0A841JQY0_9BACT|nr:AbrB/MazE/SpoVT family DNA-binding domain-containing protein [Silvibacterium bohemicum]MBB6142825.1 antitoxin VapB [Silvibacterium bohemicum]